MRDVSEIAVGSVILAFPVSLSEEVWNIGAELSVWRAVLYPSVDCLLCYGRGCRDYIALHRPS